MAQIICLANSRKNRNRCIAGLTDKGLWVRPVSELPDGSITRPMRLIDGAEPQLLDVLRIPLERSGPDFGHQPENRLLRPGKWARVGVVKVCDLVEFCEKKKLLLHTASDRVPEQTIAGMPAARKCSLQLITVSDAGFREVTSIRGRRQVRATFSYAGNSYDIVVTDPVAEQWVREGKRPGENCILTVSMAGPYPDGNYFKFVAGVIEP